MNKSCVKMQKDTKDYFLFKKEKMDLPSFFRNNSDHELRGQTDNLFWKIQFHPWEEHMSHDEWIENKILTFYQFAIR
jgi:hypothetical protein